MLKAGVSRVNITPSAGTTLAGYAARTQAATGVHDDLYARALVLSADDVAVGLIVVDVLLLTGDFVEDIRDAVSTATGLEKRHIIVAATHTHAGPGGLVSQKVYDGVLSFASAFLGTPDAAIQASLKSAIVVAVQEALANQQVVRVSVSVGCAPNVGANRRSPDGPADTDVVVARFDGLDGQTHALLFSQACHPTVLGPENRLFSGDLVGLACRALENAGDGLIALGLSGAAGDVSTRYTRRESTFDEAERLAGLLADAVREAAVDMTPINDVHLWLNCGKIALPTTSPPSREELQRRLDVARQALAEARRQNVPTWQLRQAETIVEGIEFQQGALQQRVAQDLMPVEVCTLQVGQMILCTFPVELFAHLGLTLRQAAGADRTLVACYANDYLGYMPSRSDYEKGGYEVDMALFAQEAGEQLVAFALDLLRDNPRDPPRLES